jgi:hypothetical protein
MGFGVSFMGGVIREIKNERLGGSCASRLLVACYQFPLTKLDVPPWDGLFV